MTATPLLVFADDWGRHPSSCQHLVRRLRESCPVLWVNTIGTRQVRADALTFRRGVEKIRNWTKGLVRVAERMWVLDLPMLPGLGNRLLRHFNSLIATTYLRRTLARLELRRPVVLTTLPYIDWLIHNIPRRKLIYYCTDDYSNWPSADRETLILADRAMSEQADLILAVSNALVSSHEHTRRCVYFPHAVDFEHFAASRDATLADELKKIPGPRIGFFGLIYEKLDFALLASVAKHFRQASLVLVGPVAYCPQEFASLPNVHLLGQRPYHDLHRYIAGLDVLLLPYVNDPMIRQSSPLKLRECLASGKPTVSIDVPEVRSARPHVRIGTTAAEFVSEVGEAINEPPDPAVVRGRQFLVQDDSWDNRAQELRVHLSRLLQVPALART